MTALNTFQENSFILARNPVVRAIVVEVIHPECDTQEFLSFLNGNGTLKELIADSGYDVSLGKAFPASTVMVFDFGSDGGDAVNVVSFFDDFCEEMVYEYEREFGSKPYCEEKPFNTPETILGGKEANPEVMEIILGNV